MGRPRTSGPKFIVYGLIDPRNGEIRYVGKSSNGLHRPKTHYFNKDPTHRTHWIQVLKRLGINYEVTTLEVLESYDGLEESEIFWIGYLRFVGARLTNHTSGGEGSPGRKLSPESIAKMIRSHGGLDRKRTGEVVKLYLEGLSLVALSDKFKVGTGSIHNVLKEAECKLRSSTDFHEKVKNTEFTNKVSLLYLEGNSVSQVSRILKVAPGTITKALAKLDIQIRRHKSFSETEVREVCSLYAAGEGTPEIAVKYDVSIDLVWKTLKRSGIVLRSFSEAKRLSDSAKRSKTKTQTNDTRTSRSPRVSLV